METVSGEAPEHAKTLYGFLACPPSLTLLLLLNGTLPCAGRHGWARWHCPAMGVLRALFVSEPSQGHNDVTLPHTSLALTRHYRQQLLVSQFTLEEKVLNIMSFLRMRYNFVLIPSFLEESLNSEATFVTRRCIAAFTLT